MNYFSGDIAKRIELLFDNINEKPYKVFPEKLGLAKNTLNNFRSSMPKADNLAKIADYLNCSVDYLLGRTPCPEINISGNTQNNVNGDNNINVNNNDELAGELSSLLKSLDLRKRTELMTMIYQFVDTNKKE